jgi:hypothetical protein
MAYRPQVDTDGKVRIVNDTVIVKDGADCCCEATYFQAQRCSDGALVDLWFAESYFGGSPPTDVDPYFFRQDGACYNVNGENTSTTPGTIASPEVAEITDCDDEDCCLELANCDRASVVFEVTFSGSTACGCMGTFELTSSPINGTFTLVYNATFDDWCYYDPTGVTVTTYAGSPCSGGSTGTQTYPLIIRISDGGAIGAGGSVGLSVTAGPVTGTTGTDCSARGVVGSIVLFNQGDNCARNGMVITEGVTTSANCPPGAPGNHWAYGGTVTVTWEC